MQSVKNHKSVPLDLFKWRMKQKKQKNKFM